VAVASAGPYACLHLAPEVTITHNHASTPPLKFFTDRMPFLLPSQQRQSTEGIGEKTMKREKKGKRAMQDTDGH